MGEETLQTVVKSCCVTDCFYNNRDSDTCGFGVTSDGIDIDDKGNCQSKVVDMEYLRAQWKYEK